MAHGKLRIWSFIWEARHICRLTRRLISEASRRAQSPNYNFSLRCLPITFSTHLNDLTFNSPLKSDTKHTFPGADLMSAKDIGVEDDVCFSAVVAEVQNRLEHE